MTENNDTQGIAQVQAFIEKLKDGAFRKSIRLPLHNLRAGDWAGLVKIASEAGFSFTPEDFKRVVPLGFFKGSGKRPEQGWDVSTLAD